MIIQVLFLKSQTLGIFIQMSQIFLIYFPTTLLFIEHILLTYLIVHKV